MAVLDFQAMSVSTIDGLSKRMAKRPLGADNYLCTGILLGICYAIWQPSILSSPKAKFGKCMQGFGLCTCSFVFNLKMNSVCRGADRPR